MSTSYTIEEVRGIIEHHGCYLLSRTYTNRSAHIKVGCWTCKKQWTTTLKNFISKTYPCKICGYNTTQIKLYEIIRSKYRDAVLNYRGFAWLKTKSGGLQEIDIYVPSIKLALEYDGEQHFRPVCFGGISKERAQQNLQQTRRRDKRKNAAIKKHNGDIKIFVRFNYKENITYEYVFSKLRKYMPDNP